MAAMVRPQQTLNQFRADPTYLGDGTYSRVFKIQIPQGPQVARKQFHPGLNHEKDIEAAIMSKVGVHRNVVRMISIGDSYIDFELLPKRDLHVFRHSAEYSTITAKQVNEIILGCLRGLEHIHKTLNKAHFDIKPSNILLTNQLQPKIADLGMVHATADVRHLQGTYIYMPPELFAQQLTDFRVDVYSLGVTMFEFIMAYHPFIRSEEEWKMKPDDQKKVMKLKARDRVSIDRPRIPASEQVLALIREMMEATLALRPSILRCLEFLAIEDSQAELQHLTEAHTHMEQQNREMHQSLKDLKSQKDRDIQRITKEKDEEIDRITTEKDEEIQQLKHQLNESILLKTNHAFKRPAAPTPQIPR